MTIIVPVSGEGGGRHNVSAPVLQEFTAQVSSSGRRFIATRIIMIIIYIWTDLYYIVTHLNDYESYLKSMHIRGRPNVLQNGRKWIVRTVMLISRSIIIMIIF